MLKKRTRSQQKVQTMGHLMSDGISDSYFQSDVLVRKHKNNSFFNVPGVFVGLNPKGSESDSVKSPTSPLDFRVFSNLGNPSRSSTSEGASKTWGCTKVGLGIVDSLDDEMKQSGKVLRSLDSKNIVFGTQMRIRTHDFVESIEEPKSLPRNISIFPHTLSKSSNLQKGNSDVVFGIGEALSEHDLSRNFRSCSLDSGRSSSRFASLANRTATFGSENAINPVVSHTKCVRGCSKLGNPAGGAKLSPIPTSVGSNTSLVGSISASDIELSEDYTCVRTRGPNAKVTHIFCDCILECHNNELLNFCKNANEKTVLPEVTDTSEVLTSFPPSDFLRFCSSCRKKLDGEDIYMYRGEKAFCSLDCRSEAILIDEEMEKVDNDTESTIKPNSRDEVFDTGLFIAT
ncbi:FCS-Like Zinc finger 10-like [Solanum dulcamara]|uniref:FCS-Like Zinc finger 10-like n=1 Tax=Solanum dulcamara TaxID=45834 RepID=UPI002484E56C|nr:FCS-Like Zinc finger 10-like [Solanum dulcamara]XP_055820663.1 FCS-Like Zinc finger 10-like [Solanum dulcamara]